MLKPFDWSKISKRKCKKGAKFRGNEGWNSNPNSLIFNTEATHLSCVILMNFFLTKVFDINNFFSFKSNQ